MLNDNSYIFGDFERLNVITSYFELHLHVYLVLVQRHAKILHPDDR